ncbi:hypothetical protein ACWCQQ_45510 [Streptomyces sp. NPDC002143]
MFPAQFEMSQGVQEVGFDQGEMRVDGRGPVQHGLERVSGGDGIVLGEVQRRDRVAQLAPGRLPVREHREARPRLFEQPEPGLRGDRPGRHPIRQGVFPDHEGAHPRGGVELLQRPVVAAARGVQHPGDQVQEQPDPRFDARPAGPCRTLQPAFTVVELTHPDLGPGERRQRGNDDGMVLPAMPGGHRDRLLAASSGQTEGVDRGGETEMREAGDLQIGPLDGAGEGGSLHEVQLAVGKAAATTPP